MFLKVLHSLQLVCDNTQNNNLMIIFLSLEFLVLQKGSFVWKFSNSGFKECSDIFYIR